jgi:hypothetical protein
MILVVVLNMAVMSSARASIPPKIAAIVVPETTLRSTATLVCALGSGTQPVQFVWYKDGQEAPLSLITNQPTSSTLVIPVVKSQDRGRYSCTIKSSFGEDTKSADLIVSGE